MSHDGILAEEPLEQQTGVKRRASGELDQEAKKQRTSPGKRSPSPSQQLPEERNAGESEAAEEASKAETTADDGAETQQVENRSAPPSPELRRAEEQKEPRKRRAGAVTDERQRSKRLFGALFAGGAGADRSAAKGSAGAGDRIARRRSEIEQRRKAELQKQDDERIEDRQKRLARLAIHRRKEQINVDERNMRTRHKNMLYEAEQLRTRATPQVFYRPWELSTGEEDQIADQISDAQEQIDKELADFKRQRELRLQAIEKSAIEVENRPPPAGRKSSEDEHAGPRSERENDREGDKGALREPNDSEPPEANPTGGPEDGENAREESTSAEKLDAPASESKTAQQPVEEINDEEDHVVEGDEDDVIY